MPTNKGFVNGKDEKEDNLNPEIFEIDLEEAIRVVGSDLLNQKSYEVAALEAVVKGLNSYDLNGGQGLPETVGRFYEEMNDLDSRGHLALSRLSSVARGRGRVPIFDKVISGARRPALQIPAGQ